MKKVKKDYFVMLGLMTIVFVSSVIMAQSKAFLLCSSVGYILMIACSLSDYRRIEKNGDLVFLMTILMYVFLFVFDLFGGTDSIVIIFGSNKGVRSLLHVLLTLILPLYGAFLYKMSGKEKQAAEISIAMILFGVILEMSVITGALFVIIFSVSVMFLCAIRMKLLDAGVYRKQIAEHPLMSGIVTGTVVFSFVRILHYYRNIIQVFLTKSGDAAYIYEVVDRFWRESKWLGQGAKKSEIKAWIPLHTKTCILTNYVASYGKIAGILIILLLFVILGKGFCDVRKAKPMERLMASGCIGVFAAETLIVVLENLQLIPFGSYLVYLPFYSHGAFGIVVSYVLMGCVLKAYRYSA